VCRVIDFGTNRKPYCEENNANLYRGVLVILLLLTSDVLLFNVLIRGEALNSRLRNLAARYYRH